jgi:hypothetical protein
MVELLSISFNHIYGGDGGVPRQEAFVKFSTNPLRSSSVGDQALHRPLCRPFRSRLQSSSSSASTKNPCISSPKVSETIGSLSQSRQYIPPDLESSAACQYHPLNMGGHTERTLSIRFGPMVLETCLSVRSWQGATSDEITCQARMQSRQDCIATTAFRRCYLSS